MESRAIDCYCEGAAKEEGERERERENDEIDMMATGAGGHES